MSDEEYERDRDDYYLEKQARHQRNAALSGSALVAALALYGLWLLAEWLLS